MGTSAAIDERYKQGNLLVIEQREQRRRENRRMASS